MEGQLKKLEKIKMGNKKSRIQANIQVTGYRRGILQNQRSTF